MSLVDRSGTYRADASRGNRRDTRQTNDELSMVDTRVDASAPVEQLDVTTTEQETPTTGFADLGLGAEILQSIEAMGYEEPTPIQVKTIPVMITGADVIAQAQTGSGKTAAFGLPIIEGIDTSLRAVQALILAPTRELAIQVADALAVLGRHRKVETLPIYGGQPYERQFRGLMRGPHIVVGTPGRVMDHMRRDTLKLDSLKYFVLDEADEMLDMGFVEDIEWVLQQAPADRQTALFSATMPPRIADLAGRYMRSPERISVVGREMTVPQTSQYAYEIPRQRKVDALTRILDAEMPSSAMIFCRTKAGVDELGESLLSRGYPVETLHGDLSQAQRDRVMKRFRSGQAEILIATDVAARGLDVKGVSHVFNYDIPESPEAYVHRIGRTGRAGLEGIAITLITPRETRWLRQIERIVRSTIEMKRLPTLADVATKRREQMLDQLREALSDETTFAPYVETIETLVAEEHDPKAIAAGILKLYADATGKTAEVANAHDDLASFAMPRPQAQMPAGGYGGDGPVRLFVNVGRFQNIRPQDIVGAIANEANIPGRAIGQIDIFDNFSFVDVPAQVVEQVIAAVGNSGIKGRPVNVEVASAAHGPAGSPRPMRGGPPPRREGGGGFGAPRRDGGGYRGPRRDGPRDR
jgi:ATP-dependent RNA helicase DeaD